MARRGGFLRAVAQIEREVRRSAAVAAREAERAQKEHERAVKLEEKERQRLYVESRQAEVASLNDQLEQDVAALAKLLADSLDVDYHFDLDHLKDRSRFPEFSLGTLGVPTPPVTDLESLTPKKPSWLQSKLPGVLAQYEAELQMAAEQHQLLVEAHDKAETERLAQLDAARGKHEREREDFEHKQTTQNSKVDELKAALSRSEPEAAVFYFSLVLERSRYPSGFPAEFRTAYVPESRQLVIERQLPDLTIVPAVRSYKYTKTSDRIGEAPRPERERRSIYESIVAQVALRTVHEVFEADSFSVVDSVVLNCHVATVDPRTGNSINPCLITLRTTRETFLTLDLYRVDPVACLKALNASVSKSPGELLPVRPVLEFSMVDPRFVGEADVIGQLDQRPNLMELDPFEFEALISNLFEKMGLETRLTRASRDGGVDCVAYDPRPIFGGKVIIQAKRYKNTVGVSAVRDLFGSLQNEGASKGILVTTSGYGKAAYEFAEGKPLELLGGTHLLYLLAEHAGIDARIVVPDDWRDPEFDSGYRGSGTPGG